MDKKPQTQTWFDNLAKLLPGIGAIIAGIFIPLVLNQNAERNRNNQLYIDIISKREVSDSELRARMFENLITSFYKDTSKERSDDERLTKLHLIALNFHETFDFKPLFESLESEFIAGKKEKKLEELRDIAREVISKQEALLSQVKEGKIFDKRVKLGEENAIVIPPNSPDDSQPAYKGHRLGITVSDISKDEKSVLIELIDFPENEASIGENVKVTFNVGYFDLPFIDNTKLFDGTRFALTFKGIVTDGSDGSKAADLKIIFFPEEYMSSRDRPFLDEMLEFLKTSSSKKSRN